MDDRIESFLRKAAGRVERGTLPATMSFGDDPGGKYGWELNRILRGRARHESNGRLVVDFAGEITTAEFWKGLGFLDRSDKPAVPSVADAVKKLLLEFPDAKRHVGAIKADRTLVAFLGKTVENHAVFRKLYAIAVDASLDTTLSQLGSDVLNDSKSLRTGAALNALVALLRIVRELPEEFSPREILAACGIVENPYTTSVTLFLPFSFAVRSGESFSFPLQMYRAGHAVQLPLETVMDIGDIEIADGVTCVNTSENAAPFNAFVKKGIPCLYTEGYPNSAVKRLLGLLAGAGATIRHHGDTDLDGRLIAEQLFAACPGEMVEPPAGASRIPLSESAARRLEKWLSQNEGHRFHAALSETLASGWIEQESWSGQDGL